ncbi:MAG: tRNA 4-thiouridine(8) synthase ThiI [candidate division KSB1 bacterium]|nr:tRNA 4-thiouridine(8) synthase ThiI [candidate division KSB1 bacterium]MDZ7346264.1 tRNA 4-thiouridine(8) synthase ThiI [candidate division KSB1 bacterium]
MISNEDQLFIIHHSEIALKKGNRSFFESRLRQAMRRAFADIKGVRILNEYGRMFVYPPAETDLDLLLSRLQKVIGIAEIRVAHRGSPDPDELKQQVLEQVRNLTFESFCVDTRRADKSFPLTSVEINRLVGAEVHDRLGKRVDLRNPELTVKIEIFNRKVYFSVKSVPGERGLPIGSTGKVLSLISSGIDSPVSSFLMMKRGCSVAFVHFHSFPFTEKSSYYNAVELVKRLNIYQYQSKLYLVPLAELQRAIILSAPTKLRIVLYRRMMLRLAERIAVREGCRALITGDSLGQVASQTLPNIAAISEAVRMPILRPLIGMEKDEIIRIARRIGTYEVSTEPYDDCCSFMAPPNPETNAGIAEVQEAEKNLGDYQALLEEALAKTEIRRFCYPEAS